MTLGQGAFPGSFPVLTSLLIDGRSMPLLTFTGLLNCDAGSKVRRAYGVGVNIRPIIAIVAIAAAPG